jgi:hypothetical protein
MAHQPIKTTGGIVRHALGVLLRCWLRAFRAGAIAGLAGFLLAEIIGSIVAHHFPPPGITNLFAVALGGALAYGVAATILADELIVGIIDAIRLLLGEAEAGARAAAAIAEHEAGDVWDGVLRLTGLHRVVRRRPKEEFTGLSPETLAELATLAPGILRTRVPARPVHPGELGVPAPDTRPAAADYAPVAALPASPEPRPASSMTRPAAPIMGAPAFVVPATPPATPLTRATVPLSGEALGALAEPSAWRAGDDPVAGAADWHDPTASVKAVGAEEVDEGDIQPVDLFGAPAPAAPRTEPLSTAAPPLAPPPPVPAARPLPNTLPLPEQTRPLDATTHPLPPADGGMWDHISQMLAGRPIAPLPDEMTSPPDGETTSG